jgi:hypothetical protein
MARRGEVMKTIAIDFDGVLHSYMTPWTDAKTISDPPVDGAIDFLRDLAATSRWDVAIFTTRNYDPEGPKAIRRWLIKYGLEEALVAKLRFPMEKPKAFVGIDDRVLTFTGEFPSMEALENFKPWNKR